MNAVSRGLYLRPELIHSQGMSQQIKIRKGVDINLVGAPADAVSVAADQTYAVQPPDYVGLTPKLKVKRRYS